MRSILFQKKLPVPFFPMGNVPVYLTFFLSYCIFLGSYELFLQEGKKLPIESGVA
jgi:hypothetical protein